MTDELDGGYEQRRWACDHPDCDRRHRDRGAAVECCSDPEKWPGATGTVRDPRDPLGEGLEGER